MVNTLYSEKLKDPRWQKKRLEIFSRDNFTCQYCNNTESTLIVHHLHYYPNTEPWEYCNGQLITLCETCHNKERNRDVLEKCLIDSVGHISFDELKEFIKLTDLIFATGKLDSKQLITFIHNIADIYLAYVIQRDVYSDTTLKNPLDKLMEVL
jgi:hypothetical protein